MSPKDPHHERRQQPLEPLRDPPPPNTQVFRPGVTQWPDLAARLAPRGGRAGGADRTPSAPRRCEASQ